MQSSPLISDLISFLDDSPTTWHAVLAAHKRLQKAGFLELSEKSVWEIEPEQRYVVMRNGSSFCAFVTPRRLPKKVRLFASHTDSPSLKLKPFPEIRKYRYVVLGVEICGSPLLSSWFNRDLGIAGQIFYTCRQGQIKNTLVRFDRYPITLPQLAIHLDRDVNERGLQLDKQEDLNALAALERSVKGSSFLELLLRQDIDFERIMAHDLLLFPLEKARLLGYEHSLLAAYRIDSLASVHAALTALLHYPESLEEEIKMVVFWDNEETGSCSAQGVQSPFISQILERLIHGFKGTREEYFCLINRSTCLSIDLAHALHPNHPEKHDPHHAPLLGEGIVLKSNAQQRYATSASSSLSVRVTAAIKQLPLQTFISHNEIPCGTTIGPLHARQTGMPTVDIGCAQLSMHACRELMACQDHIDMCHLLGALFQTACWPEAK